MSNEEKDERSDEFKRFDAVVSHVMSVPKSEIDKRMSEFKKKQEKKKRAKKLARESDA